MRTIDEAVAMLQARKAAAIDGYDESDNVVGGKASIGQAKLWTSGLGLDLDEALERAPGCAQFVFESIGHGCSPLETFLSLWIDGLTTGLAMAEADRHADQDEPADPTTPDYPPPP